MVPSLYMSLVCEKAKIFWVLSFSVLEKKSHILWLRSYGRAVNCLNPETRVKVKLRELLRTMKKTQGPDRLLLDASRSLHVVFRISINFF